MAGKSTYLRQVALLCLMAHIGCPLPAEEAEIPLLARVFTRISTSDSLQARNDKPQESHEPCLTATGLAHK